MAEKWMQKASESMKERGTEGSFTRWAKSHGYSSPLAAARHVMSHKDKYDASIVKKANFAKNANA